MNRATEKPVSERLVYAAADAIAGTQQARSEDGAWRWSRADGTAAAIAVVVLLAAEFDGIGDGDCHPADTLRRLASELSGVPDISLEKK